MLLFWDMPRFLNFHLFSYFDYSSFDSHHVLSSSSSFSSIVICRHRGKNEILLSSASVIQGVLELSEQQPQHQQHAGGRDQTTKTTATTTWSATTLPHVGLRDWGLSNLGMSDGKGLFCVFSRFSGCCSCPPETKRGRKRPISRKGGQTHPIFSSPSSNNMKRFQAETWIAEDLGSE